MRGRVIPPPLLHTRVHDATSPPIPLPPWDTYFTGTAASSKRDELRSAYEKGTACSQTEEQ